MEKIKEILEKIQSSIPFLSKKQSDDDSDKLESSESTQIDHQLNKSNEEIDNDSDGNVSDDGAEEGKRKGLDEKKKLILYIAVLAGVVMNLPDSDEDNGSSEDEIVTTKPTKKNKKTKTKIKKSDSEMNESIDANSISNFDEQNSQEEFVIPDESTVTEDIAPQKKAPEKLSDLTNFDTSSEVSEERIKKTSPSPFEQMPSVQDLNTNGFENNISNDTPSETGSISTFDKISEKLNDEINKKKIINVNYESLGRGLAYNCKVGYWVCLDKKEYLNCRENLKWANKLGNEKECVPHDVYGGIKDCQIMQVHNINTNSSNKFCN